MLLILQKLLQKNIINSAEIVTKIFKKYLGPIKYIYMYNMPYTMRKVRCKPCFKVYNQKTKRVYSKCTSKEKAQKQIKLLRAIEYNKDFVPRKAAARSKKSEKIKPLKK